MEVLIDGHNLTIEDVVNVSRKKVKVKLSEKCKKKISECRDAVDKMVKDKKVVYGLTTGFASFKDVAITEDQTEELQKNLIESHSVGVGNPFKEEIVRAAILVRINSLSQGHSGVRLIVIQTLIDMLNRGIYPFVPEKGSVGSSGDLAPLSHLMLVLMGKGEAFYNGKKIKGSLAMKKAKISPLKLKSKEGLVKKEKIMVLSVNQEKEAIEIVEKLRDKGLKCYYSNIKISKALDYANSKNVSKVIFVGEKELKENRVKMKDMLSGEEKLVSVDEIK